jgi:ABC-type nitrate/sulfonate/bicarbonate transport system permease component
MSESAGRLIRAIEAMWLVVALGVLWWLLSDGSHSLFFPPLRAILAAFRDDWLFRRWTSDLVPSLFRFGVGYAIGVVVGVTAGAMIGRSSTLRAMTRWNVMFMNATPPVALIPLSLLVFGIGDAGKIFLIATAVSSITVLTTIDGMAGVGLELHEMARVYNLPARSRLVRVLLPAAAPQIVAGMRASLSVALLLVVTSELVASTSGVGYFLLDAQRTFSIPEMWSAMLLLAILGYMLNSIFEFAERRVLFWHRTVEMK